jgi:hypothetical protein
LKRFGGKHDRGGGGVTVGPQTKIRFERVKSEEIEDDYIRFLSVLIGGKRLKTVYLVVAEQPE